MVVYDSEFWARQILFRDCLKTDPKIAQEYAKLKYSLAERYRSDMVAYTEGKSDFIEDILLHASARVIPSG